ncbi:DUF2061 domain-containing protein [Paracoccus sp. R12_1]|uniref:DUF2061 domain-containing protein n=1 Tax=unclassified Paracoccus (in: a-proteobacteria) TaxID=2688777 RepID=UPI001AD9AD1C|nr:MULTISPECIES: DUF2061 domain-containing protein [unclassified Paracoccus (in: a-proteobacteria)]MBO9454534.1 DUF2061 domain-containing protein [Paracoccus sp. R12_2]MBO9486088.1 DUF2061 domain-containing protein [Paracoccus sp. R12_1]
MDTRKRSVLKAVLWQILGLVVMTLVGFALTGSVRVGGGMALINAALGLVLYLGYERLWQHIRWGRIAG